jgi:hypothetical protein
VNPRLSNNSVFAMAAIPAEAVGVESDFYPWKSGANA